MMQYVYASVDLGGTKIACALATGDGQILAEQAIPTQSHEGPQAVLERIGALVQALTEQHNCQPVALGMGVPGLVDLPNGMVKFLPNLATAWRGVAVRDWLEPRLGYPVFLLNDVRLATLGELTFGRGRNVGCLAFFAIGTGIGGGIAINGQVRLGKVGSAGELGHQTILPDGPRCGCGNTGCLEALASGPAITAEGVRLLLSAQSPKLFDMVGGDPSRVTPREMALAAKAGDEAVHRALVRAARYVGIAVANVIVMLHPDLVILGGSVAQIGSLLFDTVQEVVTRRVKVFPVETVRIEPSSLGAKATLWGGIALAKQGGLAPD